jgi:hypothetical protein
LNAIDHGSVDEKILHFRVNTWILELHTSERKNSKTPYLKSETTQRTKLSLKLGIFCKSKNIYKIYALK